MDFAILLVFCFNGFHQHLSCLLLFIFSFLTRESDCLSDHVDHVCVIDVPREHVIDFRLGHNELNTAEKVFSHGRVSPIKTLNGLNVGLDQFAE